MCPLDLRLAEGYRLPAPESQSAAGRCWWAPPWGAPSSQSGRRWEGKCSSPPVLRFRDRSAMARARKA